MLIKTISSMEKVLPEVEPIELEQGNVMLTNERFHFQIAMQNDSDQMMKLLRVKITGLPEEYITIRTVELVPAGYLWPTVDDYYISTKTGLFPDLLKPLSQKGLVLPCKQWRSVWVTIHSEKGIPPSKYDLSIQIIDPEKAVVGECSYALEVKAQKLPICDLKITNWMHYDCISHKHNVELFDDAFYGIFEKYLQAYVLSGQNMLLIPLFTPPLDTLVGGERKTAQLIDVKRTKDGYSFGFEKLKKFISFAMARGIKYIEFSHLFTQWGGACCPKIMAETENGFEKIFGWETSSTSEEYVAFLQTFLPELMTCIEELGIKDKCYFHLTDEPKTEHLETYQKCRDMVKRYVKDCPIIDAISHYDFYEKGLIDIPVAVTDSYPAFQEHNVSNMFVYYCCIPCDGYYSNRALGMPLQRTRILGWQLYASGVQGFLHWGFNFYNTAYSLEEVDPYADTTAGGMFPSGDSFIVYPAKDGVLMTIRAECIGEAMQDYQLCMLLAERIGKEKVQELLHACCIKAYNQYPHSVRAHKAIRQKLIEGLID
jgi:hypothetical protein